VVVNKNKYIIYDRKTGQIPNKEKDDVSNQLKVYAYKILLKI
jgi:RecB family exonuclease